jgi:hypothetical protein
MGVVKYVVRGASAVAAAKEKAVKGSDRVWIHMEVVQDHPEVGMPWAIRMAAPASPTEAPPGALLKLALTPPSPMKEGTGDGTLWWVAFESRKKMEDALRQTATTIWLAGPVGPAAPLPGTKWVAEVAKHMKADAVAERLKKVARYMREFAGLAVWVYARKDEIGIDVFPPAKLAGKRIELGYGEVAMLRPWKVGQGPVLGSTDCMAGVRRLPWQGWWQGGKRWGGAGRGLQQQPQPFEEGEQSALRGVGLRRRAMPSIAQAFKEGWNVKRWAGSNCRQFICLFSYGNWAVPCG